MNNISLLTFPQIKDPRGNLSFIEYPQHIPFEIKRIYYIYDISEGAERGAHGHKKLEQVIIPLSGSFDLTLDDGHTRKTFSLKKPWQGLYIPPMMWRDLNNFSSGSVCLVLASDVYKEEDYYRDYKDFLNDVNG